MADVSVQTSESAANPLDIIEEIVTANEWPFDRAAEEELVAQVPGKWCDYRIYFAADDQTVRIQRVVHSHSLQDFLFRSNLPGSGEDEQLAKSKHFWQLIDEGARTLKTI